MDFQRWILDHPALNLGITSMDTMKQEEQECPLPPRKRGRKSPVLWNPNRPTTHVSCLYPELLSMIFQYLDVPEKGRVAQVCTSWREAAYLRSVWRGVQAKLHLKKCSNSDVLRSLVRRGITKIQVSQNVMFVEPIFLILILTLSSGNEKIMWEKCSLHFSRF